jgi:hypothetical protein
VTGVGAKGSRRTASELSTVKGSHRYEKVPLGFPFASEKLLRSRSQVAPVQRLMRMGVKGGRSITIGTTSKQ